MMDAKDVRKRFVGSQSQHQKHSYQNDKSLRDDEESHSQPLHHWCRIAFIAALMPILFVILYLNVLADENLLPVAFSLPDPPRLEGPLKPNGHLLLAEALYEGRLVGPESIALDRGHLYTGTSDGKILDIYNGEVKILASLGTPCGRNDDAPTCSRPLGMRLDTDGYLIVCYASLGIHRINVATGEVHVLLPSGVNVDGRLLNFFNDLDIDSDGNIYFTESSRFTYRDFLLDLLDGRGTGRLLRYDPLRNSTEVLLDSLHFANGVQLSRYGDFVLVVEASRARIIKYHLKGIKAGHAEIFVENLPCFPDNIRPSSAGGYWLAGGVMRYEGKFSALDFLGPRPWIRWIISKLPQTVAFLIMMSPSSMALELNDRGDIVRTLMDLNAERVLFASEVADDGQSLYLGAAIQSFIARIRWDQLPAITPD